MEDGKATGGSGGAIAGGIIGALLAIGIAIVAAFFVIKYLKTKKEVFSLHNYSLISKDKERPIEEGYSPKPTSTTVNSSSPLGRFLMRQFLTISESKWTLYSSISSLKSSRFSIQHYYFEYYKL